MKQRNVIVVLAILVLLALAVTAIWRPWARPAATDTQPLYATAQGRGC